MWRPRLVTVLLPLAVACGDGGSGAADASDADATPRPPSIADVLACRDPGTADGPPPAQDASYLERRDVDLQVFPDALCNDGTGAVFYFRPYSGAANQNRWVIQLEGGGLCTTPRLCAARWCSIDTQFGSRQMSSDLAPTAGIDGRGILSRRVDNPIGDYNQVFIRYCSSDVWTGTARDVAISEEDPRDGTAVEFSINFLGAKIVDAVIATLRRDGVAALTHAEGALPDLDDAQQIVFAGASAGGSGVIFNADRFAAAARATNTSCGPGGCPLVFRALIDSIFTPSLENLDLSTATYCANSGLCDYETLYLEGSPKVAETMWGARRDDSCADWHATNMPGTEWMCWDGAHVIRHHITTPMFVRMGQTDSLLSKELIDSEVSVPGKGQMNLSLFAERVRIELGELANIQLAAHEGGSIAAVPGVFGPSCSKHETLRHGPSTYNALVNVSGTDYAMFDVITNWVTGGSPISAIATPANPGSCP